MPYAFLMCGRFPCFELLSPCSLATHCVAPAQPKLIDIPPPPRTRTCACLFLFACSYLKDLVCGVHGPLLFSANVARSHGHDLSFWFADAKVATDEDEVVVEDCYETCTDAPRPLITSCPSLSYLTAVPSPPLVGCANNIIEGHPRAKFDRRRKLGKLCC